MNREFYIKKRSQVFMNMQDKSIAIFFAGHAPKKTADEKYPFTPNRNFYYLTGIDEEEIILVLLKINDTTKETLFIKRSNSYLEKWVGKTISKESAIEISGITDIRYIDDFYPFLSSSLPSMKYIYLDLERDAFEDNLTKSQTFAKECREKYPQLIVEDIYPIICDLRLIKEDEEIELIQLAIDVTKNGILTLMSNAKAGIKEFELEAYFDFVLRQNGIKDYAFPTIAASGLNATILHYASNDSLIKDDSLILFDLGAQYKYYNADITRTFPVNGKFTDRQKQIYEIVLKAQEAVINNVKPGIKLHELNQIVIDIYYAELLKIGLINTKEEVSNYYYHSVSHFLGLDTHDVGSYKKPLEKGVVITVEPGLYIEEEGIGIRIEDNILVTEDGSINLSKDIIKSVDEIELYMSKRNM